MKGYFCHQIILLRVLLIPALIPYFTRKKKWKQTLHYKISYGFDVERRRETKHYINVKFYVESPEFLPLSHRYT